MEYVTEADMVKASFCELIAALSTVLQDAGIRIDYRINEIDPDNVNLVFGYHRLIQSAVRSLRWDAHRSRARGSTNAAVDLRLESWTLPDNCIPVNLEPLNDPSPWVTVYRRFLDACPLIVDYSPANRERIEGGNELKVHRFRYGYVPLSAFRLPGGEGEPVFFGFVTKRRRRILGHLQACGIDVSVYDNHWGTQRDLLIGGAPVSLNLSKHDDSILELHRLWISLCLGIPVISEKGNDSELVKEWSEFVCFIDDSEELKDWRNLALPEASLYRYGSCFRDETERLLEWIESSL